MPKTRIPVCTICEDRGTYNAATGRESEGGHYDDMICGCAAGLSLSPAQAIALTGKTVAQQAAVSYDSYRHDEDSIGFDNSYTGPSELELGGGCTRCGAPDDCYCEG